MRRETRWQVWRPNPVDDGAGGQTVTMAQITTEAGDVRELTGTELIEAQQAGAEHTHAGWFHVRADIERNDELRDGDGTRLLVLSTSTTFPPTRTRVQARRVEAGG